MQREHHYFNREDRHEYWECPHDLSDWHKVAKSIGADWNGDTYNYVTWSNPPTRVSNNYPPRSQY